MNRSIARWQACSPKALAHDQSIAAIEYAFEDARHDILELHDQNNRLRGMLMMVAYPRRGTSEESLTIQQFADLIKSAYTIEQLLKNE